jgi:hypothetical protein
VFVLYIVTVNNLWLSKLLLILIGQIRERRRGGEEERRRGGEEERRRGGEEERRRKRGIETERQGHLPSH